MRARAFFVVLSAVAGLVPLAEAHADEPVVTCEASFEAADLDLRPNESRLLDARAALRGCSLPTCKPWMIDDCSKRLMEVEARIPSVAFSAEDGRGAPLYDVRVLEGDREIVGRVNGVALEMNPGPHDLVAERDGARVSRSVVIIEGKKAQQVVFTFPSDPLRSSVVSTKAIGAKREPSPFLHPWARTFAGGLLAGAGLALVTGTILGAVALSSKEDARCDAANVCDEGPLNDARFAARSANVAFGLAGALALGSVVTFVAFGRTRVQTAASLQQVQVATSW